MKLIGMLDSPFVRRTAIGMQQLDLKFEHQSLSVFKDYDTFKKLNSLVKAPSLVLGNGIVLVDSSLILQYAESISDHSLLSQKNEALALQIQVIGTASIANEKTVQIVYEHELRPEDKRHQPWLNRVNEQLNSTFQVLETLVAQNSSLFNIEHLNHASISAAVAWYFTQHIRPGLIAENDFPALSAWSEKAEQTAAFLAYPYDFSMS